MSDWIEVDGKRYYEQGYLIMANKTAERRRKLLVEFSAKLSEITKELESHLGTTIEMKSRDK